jgi:hypothetical protein
LQIKSYGNLWERKYIHFGSQGKPGSMLGHNSRVDDVDFRDQIGIYILYDKNMKMVYVGQAGNGKANIFSRIKQHTDDHLWNRWEYCSWYGFKSVNKDSTLSQKDHVEKSFQISGSDLLNELEGLLITVIEPTLNKQGAKWSGVEEFYQEIHEDLEEFTIGDLMQEQEKLSSKIDKLLKQKKS